MINISTKYFLNWKGYKL